ncbi:MAG: glycosyltransferase family 4 protein [Bacteroidetes bacterium]|nr:glycosyltransferase family 4 protein [Bacteroidota bacterium]
MCELDNSIHITLLTNRKPLQLLPTHEQITHHYIPSIERYLRPGRVWKPILPMMRRQVFKLRLGPKREGIWHSTFFTMPESWVGLKVVTVFDMIYERFPNLYDGLGDEKFRKLKRDCLQDANAVICISETTRQDLQDFYGIDKDYTYVTHLACSDVFRQLDQSNDQLELTLEKPFLLYVGDRARYKNFNSLMKTYSVWAGRKDVNIVVVGKPWLSSEANNLVQLGIQRNVNLLSHVDDEQLCQLYNKAIAFVYPSLYEGFGIPLVEAMSCGCPIIASYIPSTIEIAGDCPIYFKPDESDDLLNAFNVAIFEGQNSDRVQRGLTCKKKYSWNKTAIQTLDIYRILSEI